MIAGALTRDPIDATDVLRRVGNDSDGAEILFLGVVRNHAEGRPVTGLVYEAYESMAEDVLSAIASEAAAEHRVERLFVVHRVGELDVGETSVAIAVSSPHRAESFAACRQVIEEIKKRLPIWKEEHFSDGATEWVEGVDPRGGDSTEEVGA